MTIPKEYQQYLFNLKEIGIWADNEFESAWEVDYTKTNEYGEPLVEVVRPDPNWSDMFECQEWPDILSELCDYYEKNEEGILSLEQDSEEYKKSLDMWKNTYDGDAWYYGERFEIQSRVMWPINMGRREIHHYVQSLLFFSPNLVLCYELNADEDAVYYLARTCGGMSVDMEIFRGYLLAHQLPPWGLLLECARYMTYVHNGHLPYWIPLIRLVIAMYENRWRARISRCHDAAQILNDSTKELFENNPLYIQSVVDFDLLGLSPD